MQGARADCVGHLPQLLFFPNIFRFARHMPKKSDQRDNAKNQENGSGVDSLRSSLPKLAEGRREKARQKGHRQEVSAWVAGGQGLSPEKIAEELGRSIQKQRHAAAASPEALGAQDLLLSAFNEAVAERESAWFEKNGISPDASQWSVAETLRVIARATEGKASEPHFLRGAPLGGAAARAMHESFTRGFSPEFVQATAHVADQWMNSERSRERSQSRASFDREFRAAPFNSREAERWSQLLMHALDRGRIRQARFDMERLLLDGDERDWVRVVGDALAAASNLREEGEAMGGQGWRTGYDRPARLGGMSGEASNRRFGVAFTEECEREGVPPEIALAGARHFFLSQISAVEDIARSEAQIQKAEGVGVETLAEQSAREKAAVWWDQASERVALVSRSLDDWLPLLGSLAEKAFVAEIMAPQSGIWPLVQAASLSGEDNGSAGMLSADFFDRWLAADQVPGRAAWKDANFSELTQTMAAQWAAAFAQTQRKLSDIGLAPELAGQWATQSWGNMRSRSQNSRGSVPDPIEMALEAASPMSESERAALLEKVHEKITQAEPEGFAALARRRLGLDVLRTVEKEIAASDWADALIRERREENGETILAVANAFSVLVGAENWRVLAEPSEMDLLNAAIERQKEGMADGFAQGITQPLGWFSSEASVSERNKDARDKMLQETFFSLIKKLSTRSGAELARETAAQKDARLALLAQEGDRSELLAKRPDALWQAVCAKLDQRAGLAAGHFAPIAQVTNEMMLESDEHWLRSSFLATLSKVAENPLEVARLRSQSAAGQLAVHTGVRMNWPMSERLEQRLKAHLESHGLTNAAWRLLRRMPSNAVPSLFERAQGHGFALAGSLAAREIALVFNAASEAGLSEASAAALLGVSKRPSRAAHRQKPQRLWEKVGLAVGLPTPLLNEEDGARVSEAFKKAPRPWIGKHLADSADNKPKKFDPRRVEKIAEEDAREWALAVETSRSCLPGREESDTERATRLEVTRALAEWALEQEAKARAQGLAGEALLEARDVVGGMVSDLGDWLSQDLGAREALPKRFGTSALVERMRDWHQRLARQKALEDASVYAAAIRSAAAKMIREGHAASGEDVEAAIKEGRWPMAAERVDGLGIELAQRLEEGLREAQGQARALANDEDAKSLAREIHEKALAEAKEAPFAGWVAVGLADHVALHDEGAAMSHCVSSYAEKCAQAISRVFSVQDPEGQRVGTLELRRESESWQGGKSGEEEPRWSVVQYRGKHNHSIRNPTALLFAQKVALAYGEAAAVNRRAKKLEARENDLAGTTMAAGNGATILADASKSSAAAVDLLAQRLLAQRGVEPAEKKDFSAVKKSPGA